MPWMMIALLMILWLLGVLTSYTLGGFLHPLLVYLWFSSSIRAGRRRAL